MKIKKTSGTAILNGNVIDNLTDNSTTNAPSQRAVKEYVDEIYSTDEVKTNRVWIDGKTIYTKVIAKNNFKIEQGIEIQHGITNIDIVLPTTCGGIWDAGVSKLIPFTTTSNSNGKNLGMKPGKNSITFEGDENWSASTNRTIYIMMEYTKTID